MKTLSSCSCVQNGTRGRAPRWGSGTPRLYFFLWTHTYELPNKDQGAPETHAVRWGRGTLKGRSAHCTRGRWAHCLHSTKSKEEVRCRDLCECRCEFIANPLGDAASASESRPTPITSARSYQQKDPKCSFFANHGLCRFPVPSSFTPSFRVTHKYTRTLVTIPRGHSPCQAWPLQINSSGSDLKCSRLSLLLIGTRCSVQSSSLFHRRHIRKQSLLAFARSLSLEVSAATQGRRQV